MKVVVGASASKDIASIASMRCLGYAAELNVDLCFQKFAKEVEDPLSKYGAPAGALFLTYFKNEPAGCIALQPIKLEHACEMKRLYVRPNFRKEGLASLLVQALLDRAKELGYKKMVLDTLDKLVPAIKLYRRYGFVETTPYYQNPLPGVIYLEKDL